MACRVKEDKLTREEYSKIIRELTLNKKQTNFQRTKRVSPKALKAFAREGEYLMLPKAWALTYLKGSRSLVPPTRTYKAESFKLTVPLRDYQEEIINLSLDFYRKRGGVFLNLFCAFGKTITAMELASKVCDELHGLTLIVYPRKTIDVGWQKTIEENTTAKFFVIKEKAVGLAEIPPGTSVILCMSKRILKMRNDLRKEIAHLIIDEGDMLCTDGHVPHLLSLEPSIITIMSATYERKDGMEILIDLMISGARLTRVSSRSFSVIKIETEFSYPRPSFRDWGEFTSTIEDTPGRDELIYKLVLDNLHRKICIFTEHKPYARRLHRALQMILEGRTETVSLLHDNDRDYEDSTILVTTRSKSGVGFDQRYLAKNWDGRYFDLEILSNSYSQIEQIAGRVSRSENPIIIDIVDDHESLRRQWETRLRWYHSRYGKIYSKSAESIIKEGGKVETLVAEAPMKSMTERQLEDYLKSQK